MDKSLIIIGGGAAGMFACALACEKGIHVKLFEKNEKLGKKLYITGKGRCNLTNMCEDADFFKNVVSNPKFMYSSYYSFNNSSVVEYFESHGLKTKCERGNRVFPESDHSSDVIKTLNKIISNGSAEVYLNTPVKRIIIEDSQFKGIETEKGDIYYADNCFIATGGLSYPSTGSTGDGYRFAKELGHSVTRLLPSLVSIAVKESFCSELEGLSLKNVVLTAYENGKVRFSELGEMLFTYNGISGPLVLSLSALIADSVASGNCVKLTIDLKPGMDENTLDARILKDFDEFSNKQFRNALGKLLPSSLIPVIIDLSGISPVKQVNAVTREERSRLLHIIKAFPLEILRLGSYNEAVITKGGVSVKEIEPATMRSKLVRGLYFIGEVLDVDAYTGGFNLQIAWSSAAAAVNDIIN